MQNNAKCINMAWKNHRQVEMQHYLHVKWFLRQKTFKSIIFEIVDLLLISDSDTVVEIVRDETPMSIRSS
jgi:hypothetical protein